MKKTEKQSAFLDVYDDKKLRMSPVVKLFKLPTLPGRDIQESIEDMVSTVKQSKDNDINEMRKFEWEVIITIFESNKDTDISSGILSNIAEILGVERSYVYRVKQQYETKAYLEKQLRFCTTNKTKKRAEQVFALASLISKNNTPKKSAPPTFAMSRKPVTPKLGPTKRFTKQKKAALSIFFETYGASWSRRARLLIASELNIHEKTIYRFKEKYQNFHQNLSVHEGKASNLILQKSKEDAQMIYDTVSKELKKKGLDITKELRKSENSWERYRLILSVLFYKYSKLMTIEVLKEIRKVFSKSYQQIKQFEENFRRSIERNNAEFFRQRWTEEILQEAETLLNKVKNTLNITDDEEPDNENLLKPHCSKSATGESSANHNESNVQPSLTDPESQELNGKEFLQFSSPSISSNHSESEQSQPAEFHDETGDQDFWEKNLFSKTKIVLNKTVILHVLKKFNAQIPGDAFNEIRALDNNVDKGLLKLFHKILITEKQKNGKVPALPVLTSEERIELDYTSAQIEYAIKKHEVVQWCRKESQTVTNELTENQTHALRRILAIEEDVNDRVMAFVLQANITSVRECIKRARSSPNEFIANLSNAVVDNYVKAYEEIELLFL